MCLVNTFFLGKIHNMVSFLLNLINEFFFPFFLIKFNVHLLLGQSLIYFVKSISKLSMYYAKGHDYKD